MQPINLRFWQPCLFGKILDFGGVETAGIRNIMAADIGQAKALGYRIRLLGMARMDDGKLFQRVNPYLVPENHPLAHIDGSTNAVVAEGNFSGRLMFQGAGAGRRPDGLCSGGRSYRHRTR